MCHFVNGKMAADPHGDAGPVIKFQRAISEKALSDNLDTHELGKGSILEVDDEPSIVDWTSKVLAKFGYAVAGVSGGKSPCHACTGPNF